MKKGDAPIKMEKSQKPNVEIKKKKKNNCYKDTILKLKQI